jgi:glucokinase
MIILAGDIGGTKTNLAFFKYIDNSLELISQEQFPSQKFSSFQNIIDSFMRNNPQIKIDALCLGIAGPVINNVCKTTNLPWIIDAKELKNDFNIQKVYLLNDLEATAYGMLYLDNNQFVELNPNGKPLEENRAVIAAGTGLGEAILYHDGQHYHPIGCEGGHVDFAPLDELQDDLLVWLRKRYPEHVSIERILSGDGISTLYDFLLEKEISQECAEIKNIQSDQDKNAMISQYALEQKDPLCIEALKLFCKIYGAQAGNLALKSLAVGGVYVGGGIAPKILPFLQDGDFLSNFISKGRFQSMLEKISVKVSLNPETALMGAAHFAADKN